MNATTNAAQSPTSNELAQERTDLALERTLMAADRSLMAWVRTSLSMISFGFTIYKLLESLQQSGGHVIRDHSPRYQPGIATHACPRVWSGEGLPLTGPPPRSGCAPPDG